MVKEQYHEADVCKKISEIQFSIFSPDDMAKSSHIQVQCSYESMRGRGGYWGMDIHRCCCGRL